MADSQKHPYLPQLEKLPGLPQRAAHWEEFGSDLLINIANGITNDEASRERGVSSVPDVWARALLFQTALDPKANHPLRTRLLREWRGLLSLIALSKIHRYPVDVVAVALDDGPFARALRRLEPVAAILDASGQSYPWADAIFMIRYDGVPVGALSPTTLVYTGADYQRMLVKRGLASSLFVDDDGFLKPPHGHDEQYLRRWLANLTARLSLEGKSSEILNALLQEWLRELDPARTSHTAPAVELYDDPLSEVAGLSNYRVYYEILRPLKPQEDATSDIALRPERPHPTHEQVVVITRTLLSRDPRIWKTKRLIHVGGDAETAMTRAFSAPSGTIIDGEDLSKARAIWIRPDRYFLSDELLRASGGGPILAPGEHAGNGGSHYVLPFRREILEFFSPEFILDNLEVRYEESDRWVKFSFELPVGSADDDFGTHPGRTRGFVRVEKTYRLDNPQPGEGKLRDITPPLLELFPNFKTSLWRRYYLYQDGLDDIVAAPIAPGANVFSKPRDKKARITQISGASAHPEAIELVDARNSRNSLGLVFLQAEESIRERANGWRVGIDFGTSNTNVLIGDPEDGEIRGSELEFDFDEYVRPIFAAPPSAGTLARREAVFLPAGKVTFPVPTAVRLDNPAVREHLLIDYFIYFARTPEFPENVYANLKWETENLKTDLYFESLLFLVLLKAADPKTGVENLRFVFSYPKAFSREMKSIFDGQWSKALSNLTGSRTDEEATGAIELSASTTDPALHLGASRRDHSGTESSSARWFSDASEGIAAGEFFGSRAMMGVGNEAQIGNVAVCLDVGGGTTDVSIWCRDEIVCDVSIKLAGRHISTIIKEDQILQELLFSREAATILRKTRSDSEFAAALNVVLKTEEGEIRRRLIDNARNRSISWLRRVLAVEFGAIAFYAGTLLRASDKRLNGKIMQTISKRGVSFYWGGNASKFIRWIDLGAYSSDGIAATLLRAAVFNVLAEGDESLAEDALHHHQSPGHKREVAGGLVVMENERRNRARQHGVKTPTLRVSAAADGAHILATDEAVACGENVVLSDNVRLEHDQFVTLNDFFTENGSRLEEVSLDRLKFLVRVVNVIGSNLGLFSADSHIDIKAHASNIDASINNYFNRQSRETPDRRTLEPPFILAAKELLDRITRQKPA